MGRRVGEEWFIPSVPLCEIVCEFSSKTRNHQEAKKTILRKTSSWLGVKKRQNKNEFVLEQNKKNKTKNRAYFNINMLTSNDVTLKKANNVIK